MAGSYNHCVKDGIFIGTRHLDDLGDALEALEEMFGMVQVLSGGDRARIEDARQRYREGLRGTVTEPAQWDPSTDYSPHPDTED
jgi:hypothetical protein